MDPHAKSGEVVHTHKPSSEEEDRRIPGALWPDSPAPLPGLRS